MKGLLIAYEKSSGVRVEYLIDAEVDPNWNDITVNGYGISTKDAKKIRDWFTKAIKKTSKRKSKKKVS